MGNRLTGPDTIDYYYYNRGNQLTMDRKHQYHYDNNGNLINRVEVDGGKARIRTYSYDYEDRLIQVIKQEENEVLTVSSGYDPFGQRIWKWMHYNKPVLMLFFISHNNHKWCI